MKKQLYFSGRRKLVMCVCAQAVAFVLFGALFTRGERYFWLWLSLAAATLSAVAILAEPWEMLAELRTSKRHGLVATLVIGLVAAVILYGVFVLGNIVARHVLPFGGSQIDAVYGLGKSTPRWVVSLLLLLVVGAGEEIFWRAYVQRRLSSEFGWIGVLGSVLVYGGVHVATGNLTLVLASLVCGGFWALLYRYYGSVWINIISHGCWATMIFVLFPVS